MRIFAIDCSAAAASVCLFEDGKILAEYYGNTKQKHSSTLLPMAESLLHNTNTELSGIDLFAVSHGPGSFTGVRIGVSCVKGMALVFDTPCAGVSTLEAMAYAIREEDTILCAVMDARCNQVYNALFTWDKGNLIRLCEDRAISIGALSEECKKFKEKLILIGDGAELCYNTGSFQACGATLAPENTRYQRASGVAAAAQKAFMQGETVHAGELSPLYLRPAQAEQKKKGLI